MEEENFSYKTLAAPVEGVIYKERKSKFIGYAYPITRESEFREILKVLKEKYADANHICYAWQLGHKDITHRVQDDGEPRNSAGKPIHGQINAFGITNIAVLVVRYFGGVKLGVGGLISAYKTTAKETLLQGTIRAHVVCQNFKISFGYTHMSAVMRSLEIAQAEIIHRQMEERAVLLITVPQRNTVRFIEAMNRLPGVVLKELNS